MASADEASYSFSRGKHRWEFKNNAVCGICAGRLIELLWRHRAHIAWRLYWQRVIFLFCLAVTRGMAPPSHTRSPAHPPFARPGAQLVPRNRRDARVRPRHREAAHQLEARLHPRAPAHGHDDAAQSPRARHVAVRILLVVRRGLPVGVPLVRAFQAPPCRRSARAHPRPAFTSREHASGPQASSTAAGRWTTCRSRSTRRRRTRSP